MADLVTSSAIDNLMSAADVAGIRDACDLGTADSPNFTALVVSGNVYVESDGANNFALRNGASAQTLNIYNTYTNSSNYERGFARWTTNVFTIGNERAGTGSQRGLDIVSGGETRIVILGSARLRMDDAKIFPGTAGGYALGTTALPFSNIFLRPSSSLTPTSNGDLVIEATNNTTLTFKLRGSDGTVRSGTVTLS
jgi:hypothetical protein